MESIDECNLNSFLHVYQFEAICQRRNIWLFFELVGAQGKKKYLFRFSVQNPMCSADFSKALFDKHASATHYDGVK